MFNGVKYKIGRTLYKLLTRYNPHFAKIGNVIHNDNILVASQISPLAKLFPLYKVYNSAIGDHTYVSENSIIKSTTIGKFCSIGPNLICGWGIHPLNGISTAPMFYSTMKQNGVTLSTVDKVVEMKPIVIGHDVFIGMNVTILDGVTIGHGAVIGAGAVVSKDIPPYAVAVGCPIRIVKYRFEPEVVRRMLDLKWWDWPQEKLQTIERDFFNVEKFLDENK